MKIEVTDKASQWFEEEFHVKSGDSIQLFVRYGGYGKFQQIGFSLGVVAKHPEDPGASVEKKGVTYYVEKRDEWYLDNQDLKIDFNESTKEIEFLHNEQ